MPLYGTPQKKKKTTSSSAASRKATAQYISQSAKRDEDPEGSKLRAFQTAFYDRLNRQKEEQSSYLRTAQRSADAWNNRLASLYGPVAGTREEQAYWQSKQKSADYRMKSALIDDNLFDPTVKQDYNRAKQDYDLAQTRLDAFDAYKEYEKQNKTASARNAYGKMSYDNLLQTIESGYLPEDQRRLAEEALKSKANSSQAKAMSDRYAAQADALEQGFDEDYEDYMVASYLGENEQEKEYRRQKEINNLRRLAQEWGERSYMAGGEELSQPNMQNAAEAGMTVDPRSLANRYDDDQYQFIMGDGQSVNPTLASRSRILTGKEQAAMTPNEKLTYAQIYDDDRANGTNNADRYLKWLQYSLGERIQQRKQNEINAKMNEQRAGSYSAEEFRNLSEDQQLRAALSDPEWFVRARFSNLASGVGAIDAAVQKLNNNLSGDYYKPVNWNSAAFTPHTVSETISQNQLSRIDSAVGRFAYQTAGSMADSLVVMGAAMLGIPATTAILGGAAATDSMLKAKERGASDTQAISVGLFSGVAEALFENVSLERLLTAGTPATIKEVIKNIFLRQGITEASEEVFTTIANTLTDAIIMGDKSEIRTNIRQYLEQGYSQSDAEKLAAIEWVKDLGLDALGGFVSGALFGGVEQGISYGKYSNAISNIEGAGDVNEAIGAYQRGMSQVMDENGQVRDDSANAAKRLQETYERTVEGLSEYNADYATKSAMIDNMVQSGEMSAAEGQMAKTEIAARMEGDTYNEQTKARLEEAKNQRQVERMRASLRNIPGFEVAEEINITPDMARAISVDMANRIAEDEYVAKQKKGVEKLANISTATISSAKSIVDNYDVNLALPSEYFGAFRYYEEMGQQARARGIDNFAELWKTDERYAGKITQQAAQVAFAAGKTTAAPASKIMQVKQRGAGTLEYSDEALTQLSKNVKSVDDAIELLTAFAKKTGFTVKLDESLKDGDNATFAANVMTIAINPRANIIASLFHEAGHAVQRFDPQRYAQMKADMVSWYAQSQGMQSLDGLVKSYAAKAYKGYSRDAIEIEIVNDAFGALFNRQDASRELADWLYENKTEEERKEFANKFEEFVDRITRWLKNLVNLGKGKTSNLQNATVDMQVEKVQAFRKAFLDALDSASENARNAAEYRVDIEATQFDSVAASRSMVDFSLNIATLNYAETYTADGDEAKEKLSTLGDTLETLWAIEQEIKKGEGKTSHSIHDINKYLESHPGIHQQLLDVQKAANDAGITCDFVTPIGEEVEVEGKKVAPGLKGLPIEYVEAAEGSSKYVERTSDEYRHEGYKFTAFKRTIPQMFLDSVPANVRETVRTELVKAVEDAYEKGKGSTILTDIDKAFPSIKEIKAVAGPSTRGNIYNKTMSGVQAPLRSAEKTVMALNLNSACPMFTIGNHGCYLDACYLTQMANGATGTNLFRTAWYTGELLQLNDDAIGTMNALGGLRINGVGDTTMDNVSQLLDVLKHAQMRGLHVKIITKQATTFDMLSQAKKAGITLPSITVQPSMDNLWIPATLDDVYGAGVRGETQLADTVKKGNLDAAAEAYDEFFGRATKEVDGVLYRKYGFSPEQVQKMMERAQKEYPEVTVTPRYVVCTPEEIAEIALNRNKFVVNGGAIIQTLMHGKVPAGCVSDYGTKIVNFGGLRHVIERKNGVWDFYGVTVKEGKDANGNKTTIIKRASGKNSPYQAVLDYVNGTVDGKPRFTDMEKAKIWFTLKETMCCQANESKDACAGCSSLCANGATLMNVKARQSDTLQTVEEGDVLPGWVEKTEDIPADYSRTVEEINDEYMDAVFWSEDDVPLQRLVDEAAMAAGAISENGEPVPLYHGTPNFGFTKFDMDQMDDKSSIFLTTDPDVAQSYSNQSGSQRIGVKKQSVWDMPLDDLVEMYDGVLLEEYGVLTPDAKETAIQRKQDTFHSHVEDAVKALNDSKFMKDFRKLADAHPGFDGDSVLEWLRAVASFKNAKTAEAFGNAFKRLDAVKRKDETLIPANPLLKYVMQKTGTFTAESDASELLYILEHPDEEVVEIGDGYTDILPESQFREMAEVELAEYIEGGNYELYAFASNILEISANGENWDSISWLPADLKAVGDEWNRANKAFEEYVRSLPPGEDIDFDNPISIAYDDALDDASFLAREMELEHGLDITGVNKTRAIASWARANGYDAVKIKDLVDVGGYGNDSIVSDIYIVFSPSQVKSADPITYDADGNVIPLTERFNPDEQDIRYSRTVEDVETLAPIFQEISSAKTSRPQVAALFKDKNVVLGDVNIDIGGGKYDFATEYLRERGTENMVFDPYNRDEEHNRQVLQYLMDGNRGDTATCTNVLNVIAERRARENVILEVAKAIKEDGTAYFSVYEGNGSGVAGETSNGYQLNRKTSGYVDEIKTWFEDVEQKGKVIIAKHPRPNLPKALWEITPGNAIDYSRGPASSLTDTERRTLEKRVREAEAKAKKEKQRAEHFKSEMRLTPKFTPDAGELSELSTELTTMFDGTDEDAATVADKLKKVFWNINQANESKKEKYAYTALDLTQEIAEGIIDRAVSEDMTTTLDGQMVRNETVAMLTNAIMDRVLQTRMAKSTKADKWNEKLQATRKALDQTSKYAMREAQRVEQLEKEFADYRQDVKDRIALLKAKADAQHAFDRQAYKRTLDKTRESRDQKIALRKVSKVVKDLRDYLAKPDTKTGRYVQDNVKEPVAEFLSFVDFFSASMSREHVMTKEDYSELEKLNGIAEIAAHSNAINNGNNEENANGIWDSDDAYLDLPPTTQYAIKALKAYIKAKLGDLKDAKNLNLTDGRMHLKISDSEALETVYDLAKSVQWAVKKMNTLFAKGKYASVEELSRSTVAHLEGVEKNKKLNPTLYNSLGWSMATPYYAFHRFGDAGDTIFENLGAGLAEFAKNINTILDFVNETFTRDEQREWSNKIVEVDAYDARKGKDIKLKMTVSQLMSLYCLSRRETAQNHLTQGGIALRETKTKTETISQEEAVHLSAENWEHVFDQLDDRQKEVAQKLQKFMSTVGSEWGNKVTMERWGVRAFTEQFYFPMATSDARRNSVSTNDNQSMSLYALANMGFTKMLMPNANNALVIDDIFNVFSDHMANMAKYSTMVLPMLDAMKWYNWSEQSRVTGPDGDTRNVVTSLKTSVKTAFGGAATQYFRQFMTDLNAAEKEGGAGYDIGSRLMSHYKAAAVGANLRVALLQPTAFFRAAMELSPADLARGAAMRGGQKEMLEYSGIAQWKDLGFYDTDIGRSVRRQIQGEKTKWGEIKNKAVDISMMAAEYGDKITWAAIWNACKIEQRRANPNVSYEELMTLTEKRFNQVIFATQVFDSTLSRSEVMRSQNGLKKIITAFMSEPTLSYNMVLDKFFQYSMDVQKLGKGEAWKKHGNKITKSLAVYAVTNLVAALAESFADAWRDDDDDPFWKKMLDKMFGDWSEVDDPLKAVKQYYTANLMNDMSVLGKIPILKEFVSLAQGFDIGGRMDVQALQSIKNVVGIWYEKYNLMTGKMDRATKDTWYGNMTTYGAIYKTLQAASQISGIPVYNGIRDVVGIYNSTLGQLTGKLLTYQGKYDKVDAALDGTQDTINKAIAEAVEKGTAEKDVLSHVKSTVKKRYTGEEGEAMSREEAKKLLMGTVGMKEPAAEKELDEWTMLVDTGISYDDMKEAYMEGNLTEQEVIDYRTKYGGASEKDAQDLVATWKAESETGYAKSEIDDDYASGNITRDEAIDLYITHGDSREDATDEVDLVDFQTSHPGAEEYNVAKMKKYKQYGEKANVPVKAFYDVLAYKGTDKKKADVMDFINKQSVSIAQKDAMYYACDYAESKIDEAPWH